MATSGASDAMATSGASYAMATSGASDASRVSASDKARVLNRISPDAVELLTALDEGATKAQRHVRELRRQREVLKADRKNVAQAIRSETEHTSA